MYKLQEIRTNELIEIDQTRHMYYRSPDNIYKGAYGERILLKDRLYDFFTYFNSLSVEKWKKYTYAKNFYLVFNAEGEFTIDLFGHYGRKESGIQKEWLGSFDYVLHERTQIVLSYPADMRSTVAAFQIRAFEKTHIYNAYYAADLSEETITPPSIALVTTTFQKESYVNRNIDLLKKALFSDPEYADAFSWNIVDNGRTLPEQTDGRERIRIYHNKNVGGAGGFARGMMEALQQSPKPTHILLMDDDVVFSPESFKRIYKLLSIMRPRYRDCFISGAMLNMGEPNIQHEDVGILNLLGQHGSAKPGYDLNKWDSVVLNENMLPWDVHQYSGWWFCCIPTTIADMDNLPMPFFVRGDDVEYSIRSHAGFISMNGICIWHEGFENKFSGAMELYQVHRNDLILQAIHKELADVSVFRRIQDLFWQEMYKFNYRGASLLLDAVEDYLEGPEFIKKLDGQQCMQEKREKDNRLSSLTAEVEKQIDYESLYKYEPLGKVKKFLYDYSCNGHRIPLFLMKKRTGIIPYGWGYFQKKQYLTNVNYAIDPFNRRYAVYRRSDEKFRELKRRYRRIMERYGKENAGIAEEYRASEKELKSRKFWEEYLK